MTGWDSFEMGPNHELQGRAEDLNEQIRQALVQVEGSLPLSLVPDRAAWPMPPAPTTPPETDQTENWEDFTEYTETSDAQSRAATDTPPSTEMVVVDNYPPVVDTYGDYSGYKPYRARRVPSPRALVGCVAAGALLVGAPYAGYNLLTNPDEKDNAPDSYSANPLPATTPSEVATAPTPKAKPTKKPALQELKPSPSPTTEITPTPVPTPTPTPETTPVVTPTPTPVVPVAPPVEVLPATEVIPTKLDITTYNSLNPAQYGSPAFDNSDRERFERQATLIEARERKMVVINEAHKSTRDTIMNNLPKDENYKATRLEIGGKRVDDMIIYDADIYDQVDIGTFTIPKMGVGPGFDADRTREAVWAKFHIKATEGDNTTYLYVFAVHADTNADGRAKAGHKIVESIDRVVNKDEKHILFIAGDLNENVFKGTKQINKILRETGEFRLTTFAADKAENLECDTHHGMDGTLDCNGRPFQGMTVGSHRDQIWVSKQSDVNITSWKNIAIESMKNASDHSAITVTYVVDLTVPSEAGNE